MKSSSSRSRRPVPVYGNLRLGRAVFFAFVWLVIITLLRFSFQATDERWLMTSSKTLGYMPVFSTASAPLAASRLVRLGFKPVKYTSFANIASAFQAGELTAAFVVAPLAIVLMADSDPAVVIYNGLQQESSIVFDADSKNKRIAVPSILSGHNLFVRKLIGQHQLFDPSSSVVYLNPPEMVSAIESGSLAGFVVGEPFATEAKLRKPSRKLLAVEQYQPDFLCNVLIVHQSLIDNNPELVQDLVTELEGGAARLWTDKETAIQTLATAWSWKSERLSRVWDEIDSRVTISRSVPEVSTFQRIYEQLQKLPNSQTVARIYVHPEFAAAAQQMRLQAEKR